MQTDKRLLLAEHALETLRQRRIILPALRTMIGGALSIKHVRTHWDEILRLATSIKQSTVTASLRRPSSCRVLQPPRRNPRPQL
jgi:TnpA family transposase